MDAAYTPFVILAVVGLIAGWLASLLLGGGGLLRNLAVGVLGAFVGGGLIKAGLFTLPYDFDAIVPQFGNMIVVSTVGALIVIVIARLIGR